MLGQIVGVIKPKGPTSQQVLTRIKHALGIKKIGHGGTLDPLASGVLLVGIGREATKHLWEAEHGEKEYIATMELGAESTTEDAEGEKTVWSEVVKPTTAKVRSVCNSFLGTINQVPPRYSALKIAGKAAYKFARKGVVLEMTSRHVEIKSIEIIEYEFPRLVIRVVTGPGAYVRSLARDIGRALKTGAYISDLVRTRVGSMTLDRCYTLDYFKHATKDSVQ